MNGFWRVTTDIDGYGTSIRASTTPDNLFSRPASQSIGKVRCIDEFGIERRQAIRWRADGQPSDIAVGIEAIFFYHHTKKIAQRAQAGARDTFAFDVFDPLEIRPGHELAMDRGDRMRDSEIRAGKIGRHDRRCHRRSEDTAANQRFRRLARTAAQLNHLHVETVLLVNLGVLGNPGNPLGGEIEVTPQSIFLSGFSWPKVGWEARAR